MNFSESAQIQAEVPLLHISSSAAEVLACGVWFAVEMASLSVPHLQFEQGVILHSTAGKSVVVLDGLRRLCGILVPCQFELNEVTPLTTHSNYGIEILLYEDLSNTFMLERDGIFSRDLSGATVRSVEEHNNAGI